MRCRQFALDRQALAWYTQGEERNVKAIYEPKGAAREYSPLACNLYSGCTHGCLYCYVPAVLYRTPADFHREAKPRDGILKALDKDARRLADSSDPVLFCFTCDPYPAGGSETTREALCIMAACNIPVQVLTKAGTRAERDFDLLAGMRAQFGTTLLFTDEADRQQWEPNAATVGNRIAAIREAHAAGISTWLSIEPIIDPEQALALIGLLSDVVDEWRIGKLNHHPLAKQINWHYWAPKFLEAAKASGRAYMLKDSMRPYLTPEQWAESRQALTVAPPRGISQV